MLLYAALCCVMAIKIVGRAIEHFFCFKCCYALLGEVLDSYDHSIELARFTHAQFHNVHLEILWIKKQASCLHHRGHETLEMLDGMLYSFDHPEQSSTEQGRAKLYAVR